ncbi:MAG: lysophospholipid acyltransferase family protein [Gemmatales bacterium]|nr:lysophospholipid acyltransferase family protein [Gemmatales bacterium]MDW8387960.1 lysophospholipid acyltransferase family protein [Gemmatales bacterium]
MKLRHPWLIAGVAFLAALIVRLWMRTLRYRFVLPQTPVHPNDRKLTGRFIYALWHEHLLFPTGIRFRGSFHVLISRHADGELIAQVCQHLGYASVRGSSTRGGAEALRELLRKGQGSHLMITPDGPRGPRRRVQPGIVFTASKTGLPIVPVGVAYQQAWRARSWDRFAVPYPGTLAVVVAGEPIRIPPDADRETLECYRVQVEAALCWATRQAELLAGCPGESDNDSVVSPIRRAA